MTNEEAINIMSQMIKDEEEFLSDNTVEAHKMAIKALEQQPCEDVISREAALEKMADYVASGYADSAEDFEEYSRIICQLPPVTPQQKIGRCKDCKWWRDSDGAYRRGVKAESRCPINTVSVANGWGYCYMFEPQESEDKDASSD